MAATMQQDLGLVNGKTQVKEAQNLVSRVTLEKVSPKTHKHRAVQDQIIGRRDEDNCRFEKKEGRLPRNREDIGSGLAISPR